LLSEQLDEQQKADRLALARMHDDPAMWAAFCRLLAGMNDDAIRAWTDAPTDKPIKKSWLRGYREGLRDIVPNIERMAADFEDVEAEEKHEREIMDSRAADGQGTGDLAIGV